MGIELAIIGAVGAVAAGVGGAMKAGAAGGIANAQQKAADEAAGKMREAAGPTAQELTQLDTQIKNQGRAMQFQEASIKRDEKILGALDPSLVEAGQQARKLMKGEEAKILGPMKRMRDTQRKELEQRLSQQFGPGYSSSSAGMEALNRFDDQSAMSMAQAQEQAFNSVAGFLGMGSQIRNQMDSKTQTGFANISNMGAQTLGSMNSIQNRQLTAETNIAGMKMKTAGAEYAAMASIGDTVGGIGTSFMSGAASGVGSAIGQGIGKKALGAVMGGAKSSGGSSGGSGGATLGLNYNMLDPGEGE